MNLREFVKETFKDDVNVRPKIVCKDGFTMSVQGSYAHYCSPRETVDEYEKMEIGFPSEKEDLILEYAEQEDLPTDTVYGWVPCSVIQQVIDKHGGIDKEKTLKS